MRLIHWFFLFTLLGLLATVPGAELSEASARSRPDPRLRNDIMELSEVRPGMKGYGLTVFEGTTPEKFDVEVIDVLYNFRPKQALILIKTFHPRLEVAKVVAGMSGSPIYINGKMIGAYAYGWSFGAEPIAGVTPIRNMLEELDRPLPKLIHGWPLQVDGGSGSRPRKVASLSGVRGARVAQASGIGRNRFSGVAGTYDAREHSRQIATRLGRASSSKTSGAGAAGAQTALAQPASTPLLLGGMTDSTLGMATELMGPLGLMPLQAGGGGGVDPNAPTRYVDGGAISVNLVSGDMSASGLGTVTRVEGDRVSAFGHPMMNAGITALPTSIGKILWFLASRSRSFKLGMPVRPVGALVNDRQASVIASHSAKAPTIPMTVRISGVPGAADSRWNFTVAHEKFMAPTFVAMAIGNAVQTTAADRQDVSWQARAKVRFKGNREVLIEDFGVAVGGTPEARDFLGSNLVRAIGSVLNNPWEPAFVQGVDVELDLRYSREIAQLDGVEVLNPEVEPGGFARLRLRFLPFAGKARYQNVKVQVPVHLAGKKVKLALLPGYSVEKPLAPPESLSELVQGFEDPTYPPRSLVVSYQAGAGVAHNGKVAGRLPAGALDMVSARSATRSPKTFKAQSHQVVKLPYFAVGRAFATIQVKKRR